MLVNHSHKQSSEIVKEDGSYLYGERAIYDRIVKDCSNSPLTWHLFHDIQLMVRCDNQSQMQIDFLLICPKGIIVIECKGGDIYIKDGFYYNVGNGNTRRLSRSPFKQADGYKWALINPENGIYNANEVFISTACAFPFSHINKTSVLAGNRESDRLWNAEGQEDSSVSFADFCLSVLEGDKQAANWSSKDFSEVEMLSLANRLAPTILSPNSYRSNTLQEILDWLKIGSLDILQGLSPNSRIFIEGGPGTGKTTLAKAYIKKYAPRKGLYLCWNTLLASVIKNELRKECLGEYCDVEKLESFLIKISKGEITSVDFTNGHTPSQEVIRKALLRYKSSNAYKDYSYIIIDEIHDTLDRGAIEILDCLSGMSDQGLSNGRFLVFYDGNQGYDEEGRNLSSLANRVKEHAAIFQLTENHRVPTNKIIVDYANRVRDFETFEQFKVLCDEIVLMQNSPIEIKHFDSIDSFLKYIVPLSQSIAENGEGNMNVLLLHSNLAKQVFLGNPLSEMFNYYFPAIKSLNGDNVIEELKNVLPYTSILRYKGLECDNVILAIKSEDYFNCYELFIGMSRCISKLSLLIID